ncbi:UPF0462 protein C4orf33 homolog isoform X3 [Hemicordylus capensis]|uniref:UPF0462 protein C4orf33 homolog isoform X3 n=1 Tax=Hemicordylus capensis TaxID=884348 RepID=UPI0023024A6C|nr:UPF0462 protein C4orf33 homolog isoform X3 [Hemicordylus capensis]
MEFKIEHTWNSFPVSHDPVMIRLTPENAGMLMEVSAPFFNDPPAPPGEPGKPFSGLWDYEVVEAFFLNGQTEQYLEVELCPHICEHTSSMTISCFHRHGQHLVLLLSGRRKVCKVEYQIETTWDSIPVMHAPVTIIFKPGNEGLVMEVSSLFFDDPPTPAGEPGEPFDGLWDYEVVEAFFLNSATSNYLEVELCPHGQHLVLQLSKGDCLTKELPLAFQADINWTQGTWHGTAIIPWKYFPPGVDKMNSYAIHGSGLGRTYEALYPVPREEIKEGQGPNFY